jgi:TolB-like protein
MKRFVICMFIFALLFALSSRSTAQKILSAATEDLAVQIGSSITKEQKKKIGVIPFSYLSGQIGNFGIYLSEGLTTQLFRVGKLELVEKTLIDKVLKELKLSETGAIDPSTAKRVGQIAGVDAIVTGTITDLQSHMEINCRLIDVLTGKILAVASVKVVKDDDVKKFIDEDMKKIMTHPIREEKKTRPPVKEDITKEETRIDLRQTLYFGGDWLTVILDSVEIIESRFIRFNFTFVNPFEAEARIYLDQPEQNTYIVDNLGNSYNFVSSLGITARGERRLRPRERVNVSVVLDAHRRPAKYITLRTKWNAYGHGFGSHKELVVRNIPIAGL